MLRFNITLWQARTFYILLIITPFLGIAEIAGLFSGQQSFEASELILIKASKDFFLLLCLLLGFHSWNNRKIAISRVSFLLMFMSIITSIILSSFTVSLLGIASGVRWILPFFLFFFIRKFDASFYVNLTLILQLLLLVGLTLQIVQLIYMEGFYGLSEYGLSLRNPGFYLLPSSMAAFAMVTLLFTFQFDGSSLKRKIFYILVIFSVFLTASGAGLISIALFTLLLFVDRKKLLRYFMLGAALLPIIFIYLPDVSGRENIWTSLYGRFEIMLTNFKIENIFFSDRFGVGTNTFVSFKPDLLETGQSVIADSMISSSIINVGLLFPLLIIYEFFIRPIVKFGQDFYLYIAVFVPFFLSTILFELFPINILMFLAFSYLFENAKLNKSHV